MKKPIIVFVVAMAVTAVSCQHTKNIANVEKSNVILIENQKDTKMTDIAFTVAKNYFVRNDARKLSDPKIETAEVFKELFGMATTMGKDGKPTTIDFAKQYVIAVLFPETNRATTIEPVSLQKDTKGEILLTYKMVVGQEQSYTTIPNLIIVVNKSENGNVTLKAIK
jgi:hypothetical protein